MGLKEFYAGKGVLITGASSGMGKDLALLLASYGARVALSARRREKLEETSAECGELGAEAIVLEADIADRGSMLEVRDTLLEAWGFVDIVVANAGVGGLNPAPRFDLDIHERTVAINVVGLANTVVPFIPSMIERGRGHLVCNSSLSAFRGLPCAATYCSTKSAQRIFMESLRVDLRPHGVAATCIHPGFIETPMTEGFLADDAMRKDRMDRTPIGRLGRPEDVAYGALFLASDEASFMTGSELVIDGGRTAE